MQVAKERAEARPQVLRELLSLDLDTISSRDIKAIMLKLNISAHGCFEKKVLLVGLPFCSVLKSLCMYVSGHNERNRTSAISH